MRLRWRGSGHYEKLSGDLSLEAWLVANHGGRPPAELRPEIEALVGHAVTLAQIQQKCIRLKLRTESRLRSRQLQAAARVRAVDPVPEVDPDTIWKATVSLAKELEYRVSETNKIIVDLSDETRPIAIAEMADLHIGGIGVDYNAIERDAEIIASTDGMYCTVGGDNIDNFIQSFLLAGMNSQVITASTQWVLFERYLSIIQDKVLYARIGNHDSWTQKQSQVDKFGQLMRQFQILNVQHIGVARILVGGQEYVVEATHKYWGQSRLNSLWSPMRLLDYGIADGADVCIVEHRHVPAWGCIWRRGKRRYMVRTGTYKVKDNYAAENGFWGAAIGPAVLIYFPGEHHLHVMQDVGEAANYLTYLRGN